MIPQGWKEKTLGEVCIVERGSSPRPIKNFITDDGSGVNWIKIGDCSGKYVTSTAQKITEEGAKKSRHVKEGDFVISNSMSYGKPYILKIDGYIHDGWFVLRLNKNLVNADYFYYLLSSNYVKEQYDALATGAIVQNISSDLIKRVQFNLPPLSEQERIVAKLDKAFEAIDKVKANAEKNLTNTKELFESALSNIFINLNFKPIKLCELADVNSGYAFKSNSFTEKGEYQVLRLGNVKQGFLRLSSNPVYVNNMTKDILEKSLLSKGDAVITQTGTKNKRDYGFVAIVDKDDLLLNQRLAMVKFKEKLLPQYFYYYSYTSTYKDDFFANEGGAVGQGNIGLNDIKNLTIPYVSLSEQQKIVEKLDALQEQTKQLEAIYTQKIKECDELKQSILQKAFRGEL